MIPAAVAVLVAVAVGVLAVRRRYLLVTVSGASMAPTLRPGERVLVVRRRWRPADRGAIVVLAAPPTATHGPTLSRWRVKRVVAGPGDPVPPEVAGRLGLPAGSLVPPAHLMVMGDNPHSEDSRTWGPVPLHSVIGLLRQH
ncbi:S26 family signal peptidase [Virgisporangium aurantiacum]|uniref:S26 family signal peptidase n=1 Tax=Virgisporangium aurantiacum TaxID=175570 RepID=A0A8J4E1K3_9ACTN|nr:S26 family signal peptidase [Virgisporangium aurantiacum]GIJ57868.1 S26 family signal peptidase [Virgisporangium aurantiacum]